MCCACRGLVRIRKAEGGGAVTDRLDELYRPQIEQFGITLEEAGDALTGAVSDERARACVVVYRLKGLCVVTSHRIEVRSDMAFHERSVPGLCVCTLSADSLSLCPVAQPNRAQRAGNVAVFGHADDPQRCVLRAGDVHDAVSVTFLPEWFSRLEAREQRSALELIDEPGSACDAELACALDRCLRSMTPLFGGRLLDGASALRGAETAARTAIAWFEERSRAERAAGTREQARLVRAAERLVAMRMDEMLTLDELARALLTSRTRLCAVFRQETGESLGAYIRRSKMERARQLLERGGLSVSEVARGVGYPRVSSFTVAFERAFGMPPSAIDE